MRKRILGALHRIGLAATDLALKRGIARRRSSAPGEFVWSLGYPLLCDVSPFRGELPPDYSSELPAAEPARYCRDIKEGNLVWVSSRRVASFALEVLPGIRSRFGLVITDGDEAFPSAHAGAIDVEGFIEDPRILTIFAQNLDGSYRSGKLFHLPIGLDLHSTNRVGGYWGEPRRSAREQESALKELLSGLAPANRRICKAFVDFHLSDRTIYDGTRRSDIFRAIDDPEIIDTPVGQLPRAQLWRAKGRYAFSISPHGNGLDCHRTWEDLVLGCIVIVRASALDPVYEGLPVVVVRDWKEITPRALEAWLARFGDAAERGLGRERLTLAWWMSRIRSETRAALEKRR